MATALCQLGKRFSRCTNASIQSCQYCGRYFCRDHCHYLEGHEAVCSRKACRAKREDLAAHLVYRERVEQRNRAGLCGVEECGPHPGFQCSLCQGMFCEVHLSARTYTFHTGRSSVQRWVSVCPRCWERRKIWSRVR
jgi:hypothetical protein